MSDGIRGAACTLCVEDTQVRRAKVVEIDAGDDSGRVVEGASSVGAAGEAGYWTRRADWYGRVGARLERGCSVAGVAQAVAGVAACEEPAWLWPVWVVLFALGVGLFVLVWRCDVERAAALEIRGWELAGLSVRLVRPVSEVM